MNNKKNDFLTKFLSRFFVQGILLLHGQRYDGLKTVLILYLILFPPIPKFPSSFSLAKNVRTCINKTHALHVFSTFSHLSPEGDFDGGRVGARYQQRHCRDLQLGPVPHLHSPRGAVGVVQKQHGFISLHLRLQRLQITEQNGLDRLADALCAQMDRHHGLAAGDEVLGLLAQLHVVREALTHQCALAVDLEEVRPQSALRQKFRVRRRRPVEDGL